MKYVYEVTTYRKSDDMKQTRFLSSRTAADKLAGGYNRNLYEVYVVKHEVYGMKDVMIC